MWLCHPPCQRFNHQPSTTCLSVSIPITYTSTHRTVYVALAKNMEDEQHIPHKCATLIFKPSVIGHHLLPLCAYHTDNTSYHTCKVISISYSQWTHIPSLQPCTHHPHTLLVLTSKNNSSLPRTILGPIWHSLTTFLSAPSHSLPSLLLSDPGRCILPAELPLPKTRAMTRAYELKKPHPTSRSGSAVNCVLRIQCAWGRH